MMGCVTFKQRRVRDCHYFFVIHTSGDFQTALPNDCTSRAPWFDATICQCHFLAVMGNVHTPHRIT